MTDRERFESIISASPYEKSVARWPNDHRKFLWPGNYKDIAVDLAWCMWQASLKQALEDGFNVGWTEASGYAGRNDWISEIGSPAYLRDRTVALAIANPEGEQG